MSTGETAVLLRISRKWHDDMTPQELYEVTRGWWVMAPARLHPTVTTT